MTTTPTLRATCRQRLLDDMLGKVKCAEDAWKVLVVDKYCTELIGSVCRNRDVMDRRVTIIENLLLPRQPLPLYPAIYFISPTKESVGRMIKDWESPMYSEAHLYFSSHVDNEIIDMLKKSNAVGYIRCLTEIYVDFHCPESCFFNLNIPHDIFSLYSPIGKAEAPFARIVEQLLSVCVTLNESPIIRYQADSQVAQDIAKGLQERLDTYPTLNPKWNPNSENRSTFLVVGRSLDPLVPLLHEISYQAMAYDLMPVSALSGRTYTYTITTNQNTEVNKESILDEHDFHWQTLRHKPVPSLVEQVSTEMRKLVEHNKQQESKLQSGNTKQMGDALRTHLLMQDSVGKVSLHVNLTLQLMKEWKAKKLGELATVEQNLAICEKEDGTPLQEKDALKQVETILKDPSVAEECKLRLLLLYVISQGGVKDAVKADLLKCFPRQDEANIALNNLKHLGVQVTKEEKSAGFFSRRNTKKKINPNIRSKEGENTYVVARYIPILKTIVETHLSGKLLPNEFPFVKEVPSSNETTSSASSGFSLRKATWARKQGNAKQGEPADDGVEACEGARTIVFLAGGGTYAELRSCYEIVREMKKEVIFGVSNLTTPRAFLEELKSLSGGAQPA